MTLLRLNGLLHMGQTVRVKDLRQLDEEEVRRASLIDVGD